MEEIEVRKFFKHLYATNYERRYSVTLTSRGGRREEATWACAPSTFLISLTISVIFVQINAPNQEIRIVKSCMCAPS